MAASGKQLVLNIQPIAQVQLQPIPQVQVHSTSQPAPGQPYQHAEVAGVVTSVNFPQRRGDPTTFRVHCSGINKTFDAVCDLFCPIRQGDTIYALCTIGPDMKLYVSKPPFVQPAIDRDSIVQCFMRAMRQGYGPTIRLYSTISKIAGEMMP